MPTVLRFIFASSPPTINNTLVTKYDKGIPMKHYAEKETFLSQAEKSFISIFTPQNGFLNTPLLLLYLQLGLVCTKIHRFFNLL